MGEEQLRGEDSLTGNNDIKDALKNLAERLDFIVVVAFFLFLAFSSLLCNQSL